MHWLIESNYGSACMQQGRLCESTVTMDNPWLNHGSENAWRTNLGMSGISVPLSSTKLPPAARMKRWWREYSACRAVVGVSFSAPSAFFRGLNSSSRRTSHTTNLSENWKTSKTNFSNLIPFGVSGFTSWPLVSTWGIFFLATWCFSSFSGPLVL